MRKNFICLVISLALLSAVAAASSPADKPNAVPPVQPLVKITPPVAGVDYKVLEPAVPLLSHAQNKVQVLAFFWYGCPHCHDLEPLLEPWIKMQAAGKVFVQRVPVAFNKRFLAHSRLYFTLENMGRLDLHEKFFRALHVENKPLLDDKKIIDWVVAQGLNRTQFTQMFNSFGVESKVQAANKLVQEYRLDGVPAIGIAGKYLTSPAITGSNERALQVTDWLVQQAQLSLPASGNKSHKKNK
jgi:thiol:disulfide interchange protein DsbA